jgi:hypothetical protein
VAWTFDLGGPPVQLAVRGVLGAARDRLEQAGCQVADHAPDLSASPPPGLPVGLQLVGPYGADHRLLEIAAAITELLGPVTPGPLP